MVRRHPGWVRALTAGAAAALVLAACGGPSGSASEPGASSSGGTGGSEPQKGGTIFVLKSADKYNYLDPQRVYTGEDLAFFYATFQRALTTYILSPDATEGTTLTPDMATDLGTPNEDATEWSFTLRDGVTWEDGTDVTCEDIKYGVSRTFATDVINGGPTYAIAYLDIPTADDGTSKYKGPYSGEGQDLFDKAVLCDGKTITFKLNHPVPDFNYTVTLGFSAVKESADTGESYGDKPLSDGPYKIESYETGNGGSLVLVRNENWNPDSDPFRGEMAFPDKWIAQFGVEEAVMDQRIMESQGDDAFAIQYGQIQTQNLNTVFVDPQTVQPQFEGRAISTFDPYSLYLWVNVNKIPNVKIRQAMAVALNREGLRLNAGGVFAGELGDGVIKPNIGQDYAPTGMWTDMFGEAVPDEGDPDFAKQLIEESGEPAPTLQYDYAQSPEGDQAAAIVKESLEAAGFTIKPNPIEPGDYYGVVFDPDQAGDFGTNGWGPDWPNASTVIPPIFTLKGGWDVSQVDDKDFNAQVDDALSTLDRAEQAKKWQDLNKLAMQNVYVIPTRFGMAQFMGGTGIRVAGQDALYAWPAYGSWPYAALWVDQSQ
jgi:peptide/nickel transport system substrate-binding protein